MPISQLQYFLTVHNSRNYAKQWHWEKIGLKSVKTGTGHLHQIWQTWSVCYFFQPYISGNCYKKTNQGLSKCLSQSFPYFDTPKEKLWTLKFQFLVAVQWPKRKNCEAEKVLISINMYIFLNEKSAIKLALLHNLVYRIEVHWAFTSIWYTWVHIP